MELSRAPFAMSNWGNICIYVFVLYSITRFGSSRFIYIMYGMRYLNIVTSRFIKIAIGLTWILPLGIAIPSYVYFEVSILYFTSIHRLDTLGAILAYTQQQVNNFFQGFLKLEICLSSKKKFSNRTILIFDAFKTPPARP